MGVVITQAKPTLHRAVLSYANGNRSAMTKAKSIAVKAIQSYDPSRGAKLTTHLMTQLQPLRRVYMQRRSPVRSPERVVIDGNHLREAERAFLDDRGREASDVELADQTGLSRRRIAHVRGFMKGIIPESATMGDDETTASLPGVTQPDPERIWLEYIYYDLDPVNRQIMEWKTGIHGKQTLSNNAIARRLNISPSAVSQRADRIAKRLEGIKAAYET
jgi:DNA-directed RNA polymerase specialized sigma subunit